MIKILFFLGVLGLAWNVFQDRQHSDAMNSVRQSENLISYYAEYQSDSQDVYVFTDINCPYCRGFHKNIPKYNKAGYNIHYLFVSFLGPTSGSTAESILCSNDPKEALNKVKLERKDLVAKSGCEDILNQQIEWAKMLSVDSVPYVMNADGERIRL